MNDNSAYSLGSAPDSVKDNEATRSGEITAASILFYFTGIAFFIGTVPITLYIIQNRELPTMMGVKALGGGFIETLGTDAIVWSAILFEVVNAAEVVAGYWLWKSRKKGGQLGIALFPFGLFFWLGFALPIPLVIGLLRLVLIAVGWKKLR